MKRTTSWKFLTVYLAAILATVHVQAQDVAASGGDKEAAILDTIAQINHINWVVNVIKTYNNALVLEEEYEKISPGNLNLNRIPDEDTLERITKMLDTLYTLRKDERNMCNWRRNFNESRTRKLETYKLKASKQAVDTLTAQAKACCSLWDWAMNPGGGLIAVAQTAWDMSHYSVSLYNDYNNFVYELDKTAAEKEFAFDATKMDILHQQNKDLLQDQWRLIRRYHLDDRLRVSDVDIKMLLAALKDDSHSRIYNRLVPMNERFSQFPEYWYYLSCVALETGHFGKGIEACDTFFKVNRGIFRDDPLVGTVALNKAFMLAKIDANKPELRRCLEIAWKSNALRGDWQISYLAVMMYKGVFNEQDKAEMMLEHAVSLIESAIRDRQQYSAKAGVTLEEGLLNCRNALHQLRGEPLEQVKSQGNKQTSKCIGPKTGDTRTITLPGGAKMEMIYCGPGEFLMGSPPGEEDRWSDEALHRVKLTKGFWLGKYEVTQGQWVSVMRTNPSHFSGNMNLPVESVSWDDCQSFILKLNMKLNCGARLPTEAEWEYACRAGTETPYSWGSALNGDKANCDGTRPYGTTIKGPDLGHPVVVGQYGANPWGFYDMHGNVSEWCNDWYDKKYYASSPACDPKGPFDQYIFWIRDQRVCRGGDYKCVSAGDCRSAYRTKCAPENRMDDIGFRLCCSAEE